MSREYNAVIGSGLVPHLANAPPYNITPGTFPLPDQRNSLRNRYGEGMILLNPEDFSVSIGIRSQAIVVGNTATALPDSPLEYRRALGIHNNGSQTIYIGDSSVTVAQGWPILAGEKIALDISGTPNVKVYAIAGSNTNVRIIELA